MTTTTVAIPKPAMNRSSSSAGRRKGVSSGGGGGGGAGGRQIIRTWAFDSVGPRKYALQIARAVNGNPSLMLVEGKPQEDGSYRKSSVFIWSEDFTRFFEVFEEVKQFIISNGIRTPAGHKYDPKAKPPGSPSPAPPRPAARRG